MASLALAPALGWSQAIAPSDITSHDSLNKQRVQSRRLNVSAQAPHPSLAANAPAFSNLTIRDGVRDAKLAAPTTPLQFRVPPVAATQPFPTSASGSDGLERKQPAKDPLLLRVARGEEAERTPVWLLRQSGRYMEDFRRISDGYSYRERLENPDIVTQLSLLPWRKFATDAVVLLSDVLAVLPAVGLEFDIVRGRGAVVATPVRSREDLLRLRPLNDPDSQLPYLRPVLGALRRETAAAAAASTSSSSSDSWHSSGCDSSGERDGGAAVMGFVGAPWSVVAHAVEGQADQNLFLTKLMMMHDPTLLHDILSFFEDALVALAIHQIDCGAQIIQVFDSWAHHLSPPQFASFSLPYTNRLISRVKAARPHAPILLQTIGSTGKLHLIAPDCPADIVGLDWGCDMGEARRLFGEGVVLQGNVDPMALLGPGEYLRGAVAECIREGGGRRHVLNIGHGVVQDTPEEAVALFCQLAREESAKFRAKSTAVEPVSRAGASSANAAVNSNAAETTAAGRDSGSATGDAHRPHQSQSQSQSQSHRSTASQDASTAALAAFQASWAAGGAENLPVGVAAASAAAATAAAAAAKYPSLSSALLASARHSLSSLSHSSRRRRYMSGC